MGISEGGMILLPIWGIGFIYGRDYAACWSDPVQHRQGGCTIGRRVMVTEFIKTSRTPLDGQGLGRVHHGAEINELGKGLFDALGENVQA